MVCKRGRVKNKKGKGTHCRKRKKVGWTQKSKTGKQRRYCRTYARDANGKRLKGKGNCAIWNDWSSKSESIAKRGRMLANYENPALGGTISARITSMAKMIADSTIVPVANTLGIGTRV